MSAVAANVAEPSTRTSEPGPRLSPELEEAIVEIARSERALDDVLHRASRLHESNIQHDPHSCLVCFTQR
ncbi:hypothetical protein FHP29_03475 [Nocardioides albidus]|uniref:Uncharacterized protein n=1 Tax=Nocardioides albidus TaxID=1517589 RepID=A0A5C4WIT2_9ACTN|nr:hypothetical protein [Nocardioides albidus]TNM47239.1 hypothetical protein FHP29_03475 [Nocardioides albidus]